MSEQQLQFKMVPHLERKNIQVVEVWDGNRFLAAIFPTATKELGIRLMSRHLRGVKREQLGDVSNFELTFKDAPIIKGGK